MIHLGDITRIHGCTAPVVDVIIGGSPCQDLSIAGKRAGLSGARSGLYMDQIRIIKEMRHNDRANGRAGEFIRPRYMVWENVPGAFSSNGGQDFAAVLEEAVRVAEPEAPPVPVPEKGWPTSGCLMGDGWSLAWRVLDAQFWGVPQRRRRIALVADFGGQSAPEILFVRKSMSGYSESGGTAWEGLTGSTAESTGSSVWGAGFSANIGAKAHGIGYMDEQSPTLSSQRHDASVLCLNDQGGSVMGVTENVSGTLRAQEHGHQPIVAFAENQRDEVRDLHDISCAIQAQPGMKQQTFVVLDMSHACDVVRDCGETVPCLQARMGTGGNQIPLTFRQKKFGDYCQDDVAGTCQARDRGDGTGNIVQNAMTVRRLTPMECERLQGFPDGWTDIGDWTDGKGKKHQTTDAARYKALGNSIALPPWKWVLKRLCAQYERDATMASLFDGIGGFPLIWERLNGSGS